jgi:RNA polymerase sigma-70 factor (ECF subfamily)
LSRAGRHGGREALDAIIRRYLGPMRAYLVLSQRIEPGLAEELLQEFLASRVVEQSLVARADRERGRFRSLLLTSLNRFLIDSARRRQAMKRGGGQVQSLDTLVDAGLIGRTDDPARRFETELARQIIRDTLTRVESWCVSSGQTTAWELFRLQVIEPTLEGSERISYSELVVRLGIESPVQAASLLQTAKRIFKRHLRTVLGEYGFTAEDDADLGELVMMLRPGLARNDGPMRT